MARDVRIAILGDSRDFSRAVKGASNDVGKLEGAFSRVGGMAKSAALGLAGAGVAVGAFAVSAVKAGSDLNEVLSKSNTVFGTQAKAMETWANGAAKSLGQSKKQALEAASSFGNMFSQLGIGDEQAASMSKSMTELASDFASFHNADISEVLIAQQAAFRGEYDAVQKFVPTINAAAVEQKALAMGLGKTSKELDAQDKALATQALLMEGAGDAAGDFARTSDGLANKQRILTARFEDVKAKIGQGLIPIALKLADLFGSRVIPAFEAAGRVIAPFFKALSSGFTEDEGTPVENFALKVREAFEKISEVVQRVWPAVQQTITQVITTVSTVVAGAVDVLTTLWQNFGDNIWSFVQRVWPPIQQVIKGVMETIQGIIKTVTSLIKGDWSEVWEGIKQIFRGAWGAIQGAVKAAFEGLRLVIGAALEVAGSMIKGAWNGIVDFFKGMPGRITSAASGLFDGIKEAFRSAINWIIRAWNGLEFKIPGFDPPGPGPKFGGFTLGVPNIKSLLQGGVVPGGFGQPVPILAHGGEVVSTRGQQMRGGGGNSYSIVVQALDPKQAGPLVVEAIHQYERSNGTSWRN